MEQYVIYVYDVDGSTKMYLEVDNDIRTDTPVFKPDGTAGDDGKFDGDWDVAPDPELTAENLKEVISHCGINTVLTERKIAEKKGVNE